CETEYSRLSKLTHYPFFLLPFPITLLPCTFWTVFSARLLSSRSSAIPQPFNSFWISKRLSHELKPAAESSRTLPRPQSLHPVGWNFSIYRLSRRRCPPPAILPSLFLNNSMQCSRPTRPMPCV